MIAVEHITYGNSSEVARATTSSFLYFQLAAVLFFIVYRGALVCIE